MVLLRSVMKNDKSFFASKVPLPCQESWALHSMLAFDIETLGLNPLKHAVTVVCTEDFHTEERRKYEFARYADDEDMCQSLKEDLVAAFDAAECLCAFNGVRFDLPFLQKALKIDASTVAAWALKTTDILEQCRIRYKTTFSLNLLCEANSIPVKISSGLHAVKMAIDGEFDSLAEYCQDDTAILCKLYRLRHVMLPKLNQKQDLMQWAPDSVYCDKQSDAQAMQVDPSDNEELMQIDDIDTVASVASVGEMIDDLIASLTTSEDSPPPTYSQILRQLYKIKTNFHATTKAQNESAEEWVQKAVCAI